MKKTLIYCSFFLLIPFFSFSQSTNISTVFYGNLKKADLYFNHFAYRNALTLYLHALEGDPKSVYIREHIAECYFKLHNTDSAEYWFETLSTEPGIHPEAKFEFAEALSMNGKYEESKHWFEQYLRDKPDDKMAQAKLEYLKNLKSYISDSLRFILAGVTFNSSHSDYGAHFFHEGVTFASSRDEDQFIKHKAFDAVSPDESLLNMYYVKGKEHGEHEEIQHLHREHLKTYWHEGPMAFFNKDTRTAFTRTNLNKNGRPVYDASHHVNLQIYFADVDALGSIKNITPFEHNNIAYSLAHPTLSPDGSIMYFSSTSPEGLGGSDIYYSQFVDGKWTDPKNVGSGINTREDESFPFLANDSTLFFSSNGHGTMGGLDILVSYKRNGKFGKATNFGGPLNSRFDDFSLVCDSTGRVGYIASNRTGGLGLDDIYYFIATYYWVTGNVMAHDKSDEPIEGAMIYAIDQKTGAVLDSAMTDQNGKYDLGLPYDHDYKIVVKKEGYDLLDDLDFTTHGRPMGVDTLNVPLWKRELFASGHIYSNETHEPAKGVTITLFDLGDNSTFTVTLDSLSEYKLPLMPNHKYRIEFSKPGHITSTLQLDTKNQYRGIILNDIVIEADFIDSAIVRFGYNKSTLTAESIEELKPILMALKKLPDATLFIGAHADARGSSAYNQVLSENRARFVVNYLTSQGVNRKRMTFKGFGETLILNRCVDTVQCEEVEHAVNRRVEIKLQKANKPK